MSIESKAIEMATDPSVYFERSDDHAHHLPPREIEEMQLAGLRQRFASLRDRLRVLHATAEEQGIAQIDRLQDGARLVFPHTVYKSYPIWLLEKGRFDQLTKWLGGLTTIDVSKVDISKCDSIDSWLDTMEADTELAISHSSGTGGTISFLPRPKRDARLKGKIASMSIRDFWGLPPEDDSPWYAVTTGYRWGYSEDARSNRWVVENFTKLEENFFPLHEGRMSADVMFIAGRVRRAEARGELDRLEISPQLRARQAEFEETQRNAGKAIDRMLDTLISLKGKKVYIGGLTNIHTQLAQRGLAQGMKNLYGSDCILQTGGGGKGVDLPDNWLEILCEFTGAPRASQIYGMTEINMVSSKCSNGHYHIPPWIILYVLDGDTGVPKPRAGVQVGRAAYFDLVPDSYWGGFVTGDEVTVHWDACACGRTTPHMESKILRYSDKQTGDDKITCAAAADAHTAAVEFLSQT
jgi:hypothetical protein